MGFYCPGGLEAAKPCGDIGLTTITEGVRSPAFCGEFCTAPGYAAEACLLIWECRQTYLEAGRDGGSNFTTAVDRMHLKAGKNIQPVAAHVFLPISTCCHLFPVIQECPLHSVPLTGVALYSLLHNCLAIPSLDNEGDNGNKDDCTMCMAGW
jgi:hypothetical protein